MASYAESSASFRTRAIEIGLKPEHVESLSANDVKTFNHMAFSVSGQPGQLDQARFDELVDIVCPTGRISLGLRSGLRQLAYESLTVAVAAIRQRVESSADDTPQKLPPQEKDARLRVLQRAITGFEITGVYEPAHCVIDAYAQMVSDGAIRILPLSRCISREQELHSVKNDRSVITLEGQQLHVRNKGSEATADISTELKVHMAFIRRGLALEMAGLASYRVHERVIRELMIHLTRDPPPNFRAPSLEAVLRADKLLWTKVAERVKSDLKVDEHGQLPVDIALQDLHMQADILFHLLPVPLSHASASKSSKPSSPPASGPSPSKSDHAKKSNNGNKTKKNVGKSRTKMPAGLHMFKPVNAKGMRICFNYNLPHGCNLDCETVDGVFKCSRGVHSCIKCGASHSYTSCPKKGN